MKKFIISFLLILIASSCLAEDKTLIALTSATKGAVSTTYKAGGSCTSGTATAFFDDTAETIVNTAAVDTTVFIGVMFNLSSSSTITHYKVNVSDYDQAGNLRASLWTDKTSGCAGAAAHCWDTEISGTRVEVGNASIPDNGTFGIVTFTLSTPKTGLSGNVWLRFEGTDAGESGSFALNAVGNGSGPRNVFFDGTYVEGYSIKAGIWGCTP